MRAFEPTMLRALAVAAAVSAIVLSIAPSGAAQPAASTHGTASAGHVADFNGDGYADQAIGVWLEGVGSLSGAGAVEVLYGSAGGLQADLPDDQFFTAEDLGGTSEAGAQLSWSLAAADFDGDGYTDLAVGTPFRDVDGVTDAGAFYVVYGSLSGLDATGAQYWTQNSPGVPSAPQTGGGYARALTGGDFDGDGYADLAVGGRKLDVSGQAQAGSVDVLYGGAGGLQTTSPPAQYWSQDSLGVRDRAEAADWFGRFVASADFNADGYDDLEASVPFEDLEESTTIMNAGAVEVLYGSAEGLQAVAPDDQLWTLDTPNVKGVAAAGDDMHDCAVGDFNGDGYADLAVGIRHKAVHGKADAGMVLVLYGSASGLRALNPPDQLWNGDSPNLIGSAFAGDEFGRELGAADFNGDGFDDLATTVPFKDVSGVTDAGRVQVLYGSGAGLQAVAPDDQAWSQGANGVQDQPEAGDALGAGVATYDLNADGFWDLVIGVRFEDLGALADGGAIEVLYGTAAGLQADSPDDQFWTQDSPGVKDQAEAGDEFGWGFASSSSGGGG